MLCKQNLKSLFLAIIIAGLAIPTVSFWFPSHIRYSINGVAPYLLLSVDLFCTGILISRICLPRAKTASCLFENFLYHSCILLLCFGSCFFCSLSAASPSFNRDPYHRGHHAEKADHVCSKKPMEANTFSKDANERFPDDCKSNVPQYWLFSQSVVNYLSGHLSCHLICLMSTEWLNICIA